jgi:hypothetical protein
VAILAVAMVVAAIGALLPAGVAHAGAPLMGVQDDRALLLPGECGGMLQVAQEGFKAGVVRLNVDPLAGHTPRRNHWRSLPMYDAAIRCALTHRDSRDRLRPLKVMVTVGGFAAGRGAAQFGDPAYAQRYYDKVAKLRQRWPQVSYWSFINEPNITVSHFGPCLYARVFRNASRALRAAVVTGPDAVARPKVLFGEMAAWRTAQYVERVLRCGGPPIVADGFSVHAFQFKQAPGTRPGWSRSGALGNLPWLHAMLRQFRGRLHTPAGGTPQFFVTEYGYITPGCYRKQWVITEKEAGTWWPQVIRVIRRPAWHVRMFMPYMVTANPSRSAWSTSLLRRDSSPRPALYALTRALHGHLPAWVTAAAHARSRRAPVKPGSTRIRPSKPR